MNRISLGLVIICVSFLNVSAQKYVGVAETPPMGWNSWNCFRLNINEERIKSIADAMVSSGMRDAGYEYVIIDDGWMTDKRDKNGHIIVDSVKFPSGIKALADYIHGLGLKFGIYSAPGRYTCQKLMGSLGHEQADADDYAAWGVDYLKYDWCRYPGTEEEADNTSAQECMTAFELMRDCLARASRPVLFSVHTTCSGARRNSLPWVTNVAHMHRVSDDIKNNWNRMLYCLESTSDLWKYARPGFWNDPDMLEVGNNSKENLWGKISDIKMTLAEYRTHFSMWCIVAAPLIAGNNLGEMEKKITEILTNKELIAIDQDPLGRQGRRIRDDGDLEVWIKKLSGNRLAVALFNRGSQSADITVNWNEINMKGKLKVRDLWKHETIGTYENSFTGEDIPSHEAMVLLLE